MLDMDDFAQMITQPWVVYVFVGTILLVAMRPLYQSIITIGIVNKDLKRATQVLTQLDKEHQKDEFYNRFKEINSQISKIDGLRHAWREFVYSTYFGNANLTSKKVYLSHRPSHYFNRDSVLGKRLNLSQFLAYPNYLIGIGLTFTFIGLATALHVAQAGLASGAGQQALKDLLAVASIKFVSSIAGISSSLVISSLQRVRIRQFQEKLSVFCDLLEECTEYKSTEKLLHDNLNEQKKHTALLNDMAKNIGLEMGVVLSQHLPASVSVALDPMVQEIRTLAKMFAEGSENALKQILDEFLTQLRKGSLEDLQGVIESTRILKQSLDVLAMNMESVGKNFGTDTKESSVRLVNMLEHFISTFDPVQNGIMQFGQSVSALDAMMGKIEQAGQSISLAAGDNHKSAQEFSASVTGISASLTPMQELLTTLSQSLGKVSDTANDLKTAGGTIATAAEGFSHSAALIEQIEARFNQKVQVFEALAGNVSAAMAAMEKASAQVGEATKPLGGMSADLTGALQVMRDTEIKVEHNQQELHTLLLNLKAFADSIPALWKQYEERFSKVDGDLGQSLGELAKGSDTFRSGIQDFTKLLDQQFSIAISGLSDVVRELVEVGHLQKKEGGYFSKLKSKFGK